MAARGEIAHAGAGTVLLLGYAALIPGVVPTLALTAVVTAVVLIPAVALAAVGALLAAPPFLVWRLATRRRRADDPT